MGMNFESSSTIAFLSLVTNPSRQLDTAHAANCLKLEIMTFKGNHATSRLE